MWLSGFMNFIWPKPKPPLAAGPSWDNKKLLDLFIGELRTLHENERPFAGRLMDAGNIENRAKRHCAIRSVTYKDYA